MAINKIVTFSTTPFTKRDFIRFGGEVLNKNGFDIWVYDFSPMVYPKLYESCAWPDLYHPKNYFLCSNENETLKAIAELPLDSLVIMFPPFEKNTLIIYKALSKTNIPYCAVVNQPFSGSIKEGDIQNLKIIKPLVALSLRTFKNFIHLPQLVRQIGIRPPNFCIAASNFSFANYKFRYLIKDNTEILWAHTLDYDIYLKNKIKSLITTEKYAIFLDPLGPMFKGDSIAMNYKLPTTVENYYPSICKFFDHVEKQLDLRIEIAAHPKSNHPPYPNYYGNRRINIGGTFDIIKNAKFVIGHSTTAFQFAILLKKPIIFLTTNEFENAKIFSIQIKDFANSIQKHPINIDEPLIIDWEKELKVDEKIYDEYIELYIKKKGTEELNTWQILTNRIKCL